MADDHRMVRDALAAMVNAQSDMEVVATAANGRDAVTLCKAWKPDIAVLDVSMPQLNGIEATTEIAELLPSCRVVGLSALADPLYARQMRKAGAYAYVLKQRSGAELVDVLRRVASGRHWFPDLDEFAEAPKSLSKRERQVLDMIAKGRKISEIAETMEISVKTVDTYRRRMLVKLGFANQSELTRYAIALAGEDTDDHHAR